MASEKQLLANSRNAQLSRGPRSEAGKNRSRLNALRHGLAINTNRDLQHFAQIWNLARDFADDSNDPAVVNLALVLAEGCFDLHRIEALKTLIIDRILNDAEPRPLTWDDAYDCLQFAERLAAGASRIQVALGKERAGCATKADKQRAETAGAWNIYMAAQWKRMHRRILGKEGAYLEQAAKELARLNRYHQRASAKQRKAIRALEQAIYGS